MAGGLEVDALPAEHALREPRAGAQAHDAVVLAAVPERVLRIDRVVEPERIAVVHRAGFRPQPRRIHGRGRIRLGEAAERRIGNLVDGLERKSRSRDEEQNTKRAHPAIPHAAFLPFVRSRRF